MLLVGLTGGIASGKTTVADMLAERGAVIVDADEIAREVVEPGSEAWSKIVEHFGPDVLLPDKRINREMLGDIVFNDPARRTLLNQLTHPEVMRVMAARLEVLAETDAVVVCVVPLLVETGAVFPIVVVVTASDAAQIARLMKDRKMSEEDARARIASQASPEERLAAADVVITNDGDIAALSAQVGRLWEDLVSRKPA